MLYFMKKPGKIREHTQNKKEFKHTILLTGGYSMKKLLALALAGIMVVSMSVMVFAEETPAGGDEQTDIPSEDWTDDNIDSDESTDDSATGTNKDIQDLTTSDDDLKWLHDGYLQYPSNWEHIDSWNLPAGVLDAYIAKYGDPRGGSSASGSDSSSGGGSGSYDAASEAEALAAEASGFSMATYIAAAEENKSVGEYMNNAVTAAPGLDNAVPVSQGGNVIINGAPSNQTFSVLKVLSGHTESAKAQAASIGGRVLNVARIDASVYFDTATVNFYMPGVKSGQNIQVYQYDYTSGQWTGVAVSEIREDHVVVDMTSLGVLAFIEVPAAQ